MDESYIPIVKARDFTTLLIKVFFCSVIELQKIQGGFYYGSKHTDSGTCGRIDLPFDVVQPAPNAETIAAMEEADRISRDPSTKRYNNFSELLAEVQDEV